MTRVTAAVVHYGEPSPTRRLCRVLSRSDVEVVVVDNGPEPTPASEFGPETRVIGTGRNTGFAGGAAQATNVAGDVLVLFNNDAMPRDGWLDPLVGAIDGAVAAAVPTVVFETPMTVADWSSPIPIVVEDVVVDGSSVLDTARSRSFLDSRRDRRAGRGFEARSEGRLAVPAQPGSPWSLVLAARRPVGAVVATARSTQEVELGPHPVSISLGPTVPETLVNTIGVALDDVGRGSNLGFLERPVELTDAPTAPPLWSGAAVALRTEAVRSVGGFRPRLFMYNEDVDLGWRMRAAGYTTRWVPDSVVGHVQGASTGGQSDRHRHWSVRNHVAVTAANAPPGQALRAIGKVAAGTLAFRLRDLRSLDRRLATRLLLGDVRALSAGLLLAAGSARSPRRLGVEHLRSAPASSAGQRGR